MIQSCLNHCQELIFVVWFYYYLGRDWYNLEKSKRVKAFRCGEYDACIETAKATATGASKKPVKYARREDAIVHALEIENALLVGKDEKASTSSDSTEGALQSSVSCEKTSNGESSKVLPLSGKRSKTTPSDSEDDGSAGNKRMRGLEDLGVSIGSNGEANKQEMMKKTSVILCRMGFLQMVLAGVALRQ